MNKKSLVFGTLGLFILSIFILVSYTNCGKSGFDTNGSASGVSMPSTATSIPAPVGNNVIPLLLGGYGNEPVVSITICQPGTSTCATVSNLLIDSGSSGVRIFSSALSANFITGLTSNPVGECYSYADNSVQWGQIKTANVQLGQETTSSISIQIVNSSYADGGKQCMKDLTAYYVSSGFIPQGTTCPLTTTATESNNSSSPYFGCPFFDSTSLDYNGIIGVNFLEQDCGSACVTNSDNELYYACSGKTCASTEMPADEQVSNPVGFMPTDNNGIIFEFPNAPASGYTTSNITGYAILGIGTQANNTPGSVNTVTADPNISDNCYTSFQTSWGGNMICAFLDTGSQAFSLPNLTTGALPVDENSGAFIPTSPETFTATNVGYNSVSIATQFTLADSEAYLQDNSVVNSIGFEDTSGPINGFFDWGFPFFMGRTVYVGLENTTSSLGNGLYWAY